MRRKIPIFYNALMLTGVNLLLRLVSTSFQVFLSGRIGAAGIGLLQLVLSVGAMALTFAMAGVRTATMYLTAEELGKGQTGNITWVLSGCLAYSLIFSATAGILLLTGARWIAAHWIANAQAVGAIRLLAVFLPVSCFTGVMTGYFTAAGRVGTLAIVEVTEQLVTMLTTVLALYFWAGENVARACQAVILGSGAGSLLTLSCLVLLRIRECTGESPAIPVARRLRRTALPLAVADDMKVGINTVENLMVPKRLALYTQSALAQFGMVCGMVFPVLMFPAAIVYALADLLIPELARCNAAGSRKRIDYLLRRSLRLALLYGAACGGLLFLLAGDLCRNLYGSAGAGEYLRLFAWLTPMLYCDAIIDAANKGLGQQKISVRINIFTSILDVLGLFILLPYYGMLGYYISFVISHGVNAWLSLRLLRRVTGLRMGFAMPIFTLGCMAFAVGFAGLATLWWLKIAVFGTVFLLTLVLLGILGKCDWDWLISLTGFQKKYEKMKNSI